MPGRILPTSDSSTLPSKIMSSMSAIEAIVVPSLKLFASMTELPTSTGTSSTMPAMVARTSVVDAEATRALVPLRTMSRLSWAPLRAPPSPARQAISARWKSAAGDRAVGDQALVARVARARRRRAAIFALLSRDSAVGERDHVRDHPHLGDQVALLHDLPRLDVELLDDARDQRLDLDLLARHDRAGGDRLLHDVGASPATRSGRPPAWSATSCRGRRRCRRRAPTNSDADRMPRTFFITRSPTPSKAASDLRSCCDSSAATRYSTAQRHHRRAPRPRAAPGRGRRARRRRPGRRAPGAPSPKRHARVLEHRRLAARRRAAAAGDRRARGAPTPADEPEEPGEPR